MNGNYRLLIVAPRALHSHAQVVGKGAFGKVFLVKKRDGVKSEQLFAMKVLDKEVITQKGQVAHTKVTECF